MQGFRGVDYLLREALEANDYANHYVASPNGLYGAVLMQGSLLARILAATWDLTISESHSTVLNPLLPHNGQPAAVDMWDALVAGLREGATPHERDATLAAISAWGAIQRPPGWQNLYDRDSRLINPSQIPAPTGCLFPKPESPEGPKWHWSDEV